MTGGKRKPETFMVLLLLLPVAVAEVVAVLLLLLSALILTDPDTAEQLVNTALETYLGRAANNQEQEAFRKALRRKEMRNPTEVDIQGDTAVSKGGVNPAVQAKDFAMAQEGSAEYRGIHYPIGHIH
jgi:hypothetical protein